MPGVRAGHGGRRDGVPASLHPVAEAIPFHRIETVFLDAGNTLVSIDFPRVAEEASSCGLRVDAETLRRAEARARPAVSRRAHERGRTEGEDAFSAYLRFVVDAIPEAGDWSGERRDELVRDLAPRVREPGASFRLWCWVLPGTEEALTRLRALGLRLVVVSNADGTIERGLDELALGDHFEAVIDSHVIGAEKPDPAIFHRAMDHVGAAADSTLHVGDLYHADVLGARAAGLHALLLDPYSDWGPLDCVTAPDLIALAERFEAHAPVTRRSR